MHDLCLVISALALATGVSAEERVSKGSSCVCKDAWSFSKLSCTVRSADDFLQSMDGYCSHRIKELILRLPQTTEISSGFFPRLPIFRVKISGEYIENVSEDAFMEYKDSLFSLEISSSLLKDVPAPAVKELSALNSLILTENYIRSVDCALADTSLTFLVLRDNEISSVKFCSFPRNLSALVLTNNYIEELNGSLKGLRYATQLFLGRNRIRKLEGELEGLSNVLMLDASYNKVEFIGRDPVDLPKLGELNLSRNRISALGRSLGGFPNLISLDLSYNDIETLRAESFSNLSNLVYLYLSDNRIRYMEDSLFQNMTRLQTLVISHNVITTLESKMTGLYSLSKLDASWNNIRHADGAFSGITALEEINLSYNRIETISNMLLSLSRLRVLNLAWNEIEEIDERSFEGLKSLETLDLSMNPLGPIKGTIFTPLPKLTNLDVPLRWPSDLNDLLVPGFMNISVPNETATASVPANAQSCNCKSTKTLSVGDVICRSESRPSESTAALLRENGIELAGC